MPSLPGLVARLRSLWRGLRRRGDVEAEMAEEFHHHLALRTEDLVRRGLPPDVAARRARIEFGHIDSHKEDARASRGLTLFDQLGLSWLDIKLGLRMFTKYPGLSLTAVVGMSVAIAIGGGAFGFTTAMMDPTLPLDDGDRVVSLQNADAREPGNPDRQSLHDFVRWRDGLRSVRDLSAFTSDRRNLIIPGRNVELIRIAEMTASGFRVARVPPVLGRPLLEEDESNGAPTVVVIGYREWRRRFGGDPNIVGRPLRLGNTVHTVVGVMPEGFRFPVNHQFWVPLRLNPAEYQPGGGPSIFVFGRLADGVTLDQAQAELTTVGLGMAAAYPQTHRYLRPQVQPYAYPFIGIDTPSRAWLLHAFQVAISLLLVVVSVNVAILVYARTATRAGEIAVRSALGASRTRVVTQLFVEALVLSATAAVVGLTAAGVGLAKIQEFLQRATGDELPFWWRFGLSPGLITYVLGLAILGGVIVGVLPALKATGRRVQVGLQQLSSHGSRMQLGGMWTALIVVQVAVAVAVLPFAAYIAGQSVRRGTAEPGYPAEEFLRAALSMEREEAPPAPEAAAYERVFEARFRDRAAELLRRLQAEPAISGATFASDFPGGGTYGRIEVEGVGKRIDTASGMAIARESMGRSALIDRVDVDLFTVFDVPILAGRGFDDADRREGATAVIVSRVFAERILGGGDVLGRRVRVANGSGPDGGTVGAGPWLDVVGVVPDFTIQPDFDPPDPKLYQPLAIGQSPTVVTLALRIRSRPASAFVGRFRDLAAAVDPALQLHDLRSAADVQRDAQQSLLALALMIVAVTVSVLLLSAAGIYAMMSFTVARRRREIGIRAALGADPRRLLGSIFARAGAQLGAGALGGLILAAAVGRAMGGGPLAGKGVLLLPVVAALMVLIGLLAALGPARRGLAVQPTEALREE